MHWGNAVVPAGDYEFSYDPYDRTPVLTLTKLSGTRTGFMLLVPNIEPSKSSDSNQIVCLKPSPTAATLLQCSSPSAA